MSELIGAGRSADVYAHGTGLVLRRYRAPHDTTVLIDWTGAVAGHPGREVASTWVIMATSVPPGGSWGRAVAGAGRRLFLRTFLAHVEHHPTRATFTETVRRRLEDPNVLDVERNRLHRLGGLGPPVR